jgi:hypothetical protein
MEVNARTTEGIDLMVRGVVAVGVVEEIANSVVFESHGGLSWMTRSSRNAVVPVSALSTA